MIRETLFEYDKQIQIQDRIGFERYLVSIWSEHKNLWRQDELEEVDSKFQPFISFDGQAIHANNYIGFINFNDTCIEIYPKVFKKLEKPSKELMHRHLFFWFSYCKRIKFPFNQSLLSNFEIEQFPELIIYLMGIQLLETINSKPYSAYEAIEESLLMPKGRINFNRYTRNLAYGKNHLIECDYEPFIFDNNLNRVIKYCARLLLSKSNLVDTHRILNEIIFMLDEVEDVVCSVNQLSQVRIPLLFSDYESVIQICRMIMENQVYSIKVDEMTNWSLLFPMEYIFEDFISGFIKEHFSKDFIIETQKSDLYLHNNPKTFNIQHDILITNRLTREAIIIDTKYKPRWDLKEVDKKRGVAQSDIYQMVSYSYRRGINKVIMIYPNVSEFLNNDYVFEIPSGKGDKYIKIKVADVHFWSMSDFASIPTKLFDKLNNLLRNDF